MAKDNPKILLINPPIYDFAAYDFWLRPLGMLSIAGKIADKANFTLFDFLHRSHRSLTYNPKYRSDSQGRGKFLSSKIKKPDPLKMIPRYYRRFGLEAEVFINFLKANKPQDFVFIQTVMTYWYPGYKEIIDRIKKHWPRTKIIMGGPYCMICPEHAKLLGADFVLTESRLDKLWDFIKIKPDASFLPLWSLYEDNQTAAMKITQGCPFKCTYCTVPLLHDGFTAKPIEQAIEELNFMISLGIKNIAFYDDSLLYKSDEVLKPVLRYVIENNIRINFHTPNALNARFLDAELADLMVKAGFKSFYLGLESKAEKFQKQTGSKVFDNEFAAAVKNLIAAGANTNNITAYIMFGHPAFEIQNVEDSMKFANSLGIRSMLADFSPIPGTADGELCKKYVDMNEPLMHNKTAFPIILFGDDNVNRMKDLCRSLNGKL